MRNRNLKAVAVIASIVAILAASMAVDAQGTQPSPGEWIIRSSTAVRDGLVLIEDGPRRAVRETRIEYYPGTTKVWTEKKTVTQRNGSKVVDYRVWTSGAVEKESYTQALNTRGRVTAGRRWFVDHAGTKFFEIWNTGRNGWVPARAPGAPGVERTVMVYAAHGYKYWIVPNREDVPQNFADLNFDASSWRTGAAAFSNNARDCKAPVEVASTWNANSRLLVRKFLTLPADASKVTIFFAIDNDVERVYFNGVAVTGGPYRHTGCPKKDSFSVIVPQDLVRAGRNIIAVQSRDGGSYTFFDMRVTATFPR